MDDHGGEAGTPLGNAAVEQHEMFLAYQAAGFSEAQSLYLIAAIITGGPKALPAD